MSLLAACRVVKFERRYCHNALLGKKRLIEITVVHGRRNHAGSYFEAIRKSG